MSYTKNNTSNNTWGGTKAVARMATAEPVHVAPTPRVNTSFAQVSQSGRPAADSSGDNNNYLNATNVMLVAITGLIIWAVAFKQ